VKPLIAGNWKMNGLSADGVKLAADIVAGLRHDGPVRADLLVCPPATLLAKVRATVGDNVLLGAQDCHWARSGAHTGDISAEMLADQGCRFVIVGHSERRAGHGESDETVRNKAAAAHRAGLTAILCIGETEAERRSGQTLAVVARQFGGSLPEGAGAADTVIAYEPVWAIGTGLLPSPEQVAEVHGAIRRLAAEKMRGGSSARILYGGSVKPSNAKELLGIAEVNGALVGGASLSAQDFLAIARAAG
jgi:triosephosphate isomerase